MLKKLFAAKMGWIDESGDLLEEDPELEEHCRISSTIQLYVY